MADTGRGPDGRFASNPEKLTRVASFKCSDDLLQRIDAAAKSAGLTRQGWLTAAAEARLD